MPQPIPNIKAWRRALTQWHGEAKTAELMANAQARYDDLYAQRKHYDQFALRVHVEKNILPGLALYQALREAGIEQEEAVEQVTKVWEVMVEPYIRRLEWLRHLPFFFGLLRVLIRGMMKTVFPPGHWDTEWLEDSSQRIAFNIHHCFYLNVLTEYGAPELTPVFCSTDDVMIAGFASRVRWERKTTMGRGGEQCDFCYRRVTS